MGRYWWLKVLLTVVVAFFLLMLFVMVGEVRGFEGIRDKIITQATEN